MVVTNGGDDFVFESKDNCMNKCADKGVPYQETIEGESEKSHRRPTRFAVGKVQKQLNRAHSLATIAG